MSNKKAGSVITTIILLAICIALAVAIIIKIFQPKEDIALGKPQADGSLKSNVYVEEAVRGNYTETLKFYGTASDDSDRLGIITRTSGYVSEILVSEEDKVEEGQIIGYIDPSSPGASYKQYAVSAKVDGTIDTIDVTVGSYVSAGSVFATEKEDPEYIVKVNIPERYLDNIHIGSKAMLSSTIRSGINTEAYITDISNKIDSSSRTVAVELTPEDDSFFLDGLALTVKLVIDQQDNVIVLPSDSISSIGEKSYVFVVEDGVARMREVEKGSSNDTQTVIVSGLDGGEFVVVEGNVAEGSSVNIVER